MIDLWFYIFLTPSTIPFTKTLYIDHPHQHIHSLGHIVPASPLIHPHQHPDFHSLASLLPCDPPPHHHRTHQIFLCHQKTSVILPSSPPSPSSPLSTPLSPSRHPPSPLLCNSQPLFVPLLPLSLPPPPLLTPSAVADSGEVRLVRTNPPFHFHEKNTGVPGR